jgi:Arc/MetJ-type ribon-helix-helix transcriptional regulator
MLDLPERVSAGTPLCPTWNPVLHTRRPRNTLGGVKTLTVRLPEPLVTEIEAESQARRISKSDVVRERLRHAPRRTDHATTSGPLAAIADLIGAVDGLPPGLSANTKRRLRVSGYGKKRPR